MRILTAEDHQHLGTDLACSLERVIALALAESAFVEVGWIKADPGQHIGIHRGAERKVTADADPRHTEVAGASRIRLEKVQCSASITDVARQLLGWSSVRCLGPSQPRRTQTPPPPARLHRSE